MLYIDFETRSTQILGGSKSVGIWNYASHKDTEILMLGWAIDDGPAHVWEPRLGPMPEELCHALYGPEEICAFNSTFERYIAEFKLGIILPVKRFQDPQPSARYLSLPGSLEACSEILGLPKDYAKDKEGDRLIHLFCEPHKTRKKKGEEQRMVYNDWDSHPADWEKFKEYCRKDVIAEREVLRREKLLGVWPLPPLERKIWVFDQKVNDRGIPINREFVTKALALADREKKEKIKQNDELTGLENSNSSKQLLAWAKSQGYRGLDPDVPEGHKDYPKYSLHKDCVAEQLKKNIELTPLCIEVLKNRQSAASTSYKKMAAILRQVSSDDRLRGQFIYMGSSRCGRWSGNAVQLHNLARPDAVFEEEENVDRARSMIFNMDYDGIKKEFGSVLLTVKYNIRTAFVAEEGHRFNVSDFNAIETRVGAWMANCEPLLNGFRNIKDFDPYLDFAMKMTQIPYEVLCRDIKSKDKKVKAAAKAHRQIAKPGVLGCIYRMGADTLKEYAEGYGIEMSDAQAETIVRIFRESYKEIKAMWEEFEEAIADVLAEGKVRVKRNLGPNGCIEISKFVFDCNGTPRTILKIKLPSGRDLHYMDASYQMAKMPWKNNKTGEDVYRMTLHYATQDQKTKQWVQTTSHGGKLFENADQGISRDAIAVKLLEFEDSGLPVVGHMHDEGITETKDSPFEPGLREMDLILRTDISWAPGLPLGSAGFEGSYYHK